MSNIHSAEYQKFIKRLRAARLEAGLTEVMVAAKLKKPQSFVAKFESGERRLDFVELRAIAKLYNKSISFFEA